jgi:hypothetical protein
MNSAKSNALVETVVVVVGGTKEEIREKLSGVLACIDAKNVLVCGGPMEKEVAEEVVRASGRGIQKVTS